MSVTLLSAFCVLVPSRTLLFRMDDRDEAMANGSGAGKGRERRDGGSVTLPPHTSTSQGAPAPPLGGDARRTTHEASGARRRASDRSQMRPTAPLIINDAHIGTLLAAPQQRVIRGGMVNASAQCGSSHDQDTSNDDWSPASHRVACLAVT